MSLCKSLAQKIIEDKFKPDIILGISRGGWVPARYVCEYLGTGSIASIGVKSYEVPGKKKKPVITEKAGIDIKDKQVLIVEDIVDTSDTIKALKKYLSQLKPAKIKFASLHCKPRAKVKPDYYADKTGLWVVYPWEFRGDDKS